MIPARETRETEGGHPVRELRDQADQGYKDGNVERKEHMNTYLFHVVNVSKNLKIGYLKIEYILCCLILSFSRSMGGGQGVRECGQNGEMRKEVVSMGY